MLKQSKVIILVEATAFAEYLIQRAIHNLVQGKTLIVVAHRLSTIIQADKIMVMKNGEIVQSGSHSELVNQDGEYMSLWKNYIDSIGEDREVK